MKLLGIRLTGATLCAVLAVAPAFAVDITGAGATLPQAAYNKWSEAFNAATGSKVNYQGIGSGGGIKNVKEKTVDFGASDMPLKHEDLEAAGLTQWPQIIGAIVPVVHVPGIEAGQLKLTGPVIADIYLGKIKKWNDPKLVELNKGVKLPDLDITPVYRSDGSGTTFNFTYYLADVAPEWKTAVGVDKSVKFPVGIAGKGNPGVAAQTANTVGAIGYVDFADAKKSSLVYTQLENKDGVFLKPDNKSITAAASHADWKGAQDFYLILANQSGKDSWPMTAASFILMQKSQDKPDTAKEALKFFDYAFKSGDAAAEDLGFEPIPAETVQLIAASWTANIKDASGKPLWP